MSTVVLYPPPLAHLGAALAKLIGGAEVLCTNQLAECEPDTAEGNNSVAVFWDTFPSASSELDPNIKVLHTALVNKHVVLLLAQDETTNAFAQLSLVLWLQRFIVPKPLEKYAASKWKDTVADGAFTVASIASLNVVIPWYRYCQMERTSVRSEPIRFRFPALPSHTLAPVLLSCCRVRSVRVYGVQRWTRTPGEKPWDNKQPNGQWLDVPTAQTYAALLSADPPPPPTDVLGDDAVLPPAPPKRVRVLASSYATRLSCVFDPAPYGKCEHASQPLSPPVICPAACAQLLLIDLHDDLKGVPILERTLTASGRWANAPKPYDLPSGRGTFFASAFFVFLNTTFAAVVDDVSKLYVVFPDVGAFRRFVTMVQSCFKMALKPEQVLFIEKTRVATEVAQADALFYYDADGAKAQLSVLPDGARVLIPDDFTNSGSTLFGAGTIVRNHAAGGSVHVSAFVTHFVAKYDKAVVDKFVAKLYSEGGNKSDLDHFYTSDTVRPPAASVAVTAVVTLVPHSHVALPCAWMITCLARTRLAGCVRRRLAASRGGQARRRAEGHGHDSGARHRRMAQGGETRRITPRISQHAAF